MIDNFQFRTASPFIDAPANVDFDVTIQPRKLYRYDQRTGPLHLQPRGRQQVHPGGQRHRGPGRL
ncbi:MAG: hypothetical protein MZV64_50440 [Ignavibacteriales bacterium]|nr:hypothetical protein [Ignavibacteriales bacterium]